MQRIILEVTDELYDALMKSVGAEGKSKREATGILRDSYYRKFDLTPPVSAAERRALEALERQLAEIAAKKEALEQSLKAREGDLSRDRDELAKRFDK